MATLARAVNVPKSPGILRRHCFGILVPGALALRRPAPAVTVNLLPLRFVRDDPGIANCRRRNGCKRITANHGPCGCEPPASLTELGPNGQELGLAAKPFDCYYGHWDLLDYFSSVKSHIRPYSTRALDQHRNQTSATSVSSFPRIYASRKSAPLLPEPGVSAPNTPVSVPTCTRMPSEDFDGDENIRAQPPPKMEYSNTQEQQVQQVQQSYLPYYQPPRVSNLLQYTNRPQRSSTGYFTRARMVSMAPGSVNRTSLHPHGVQYVFQHPLELQALGHSSKQLLTSLPQAP
jgi:hypothetical protein